MSEIDTFVQQVHNHGITDIKVILDIGSRDTLESIALAERYTNAKVYAFEPNPATLDQCYNHLANASLDVRERITLVRKAACEVDGIVKFFPLDHKAMAAAHGPGWHSPNDGMSSLLPIIPNMESLATLHKIIQKEIEVVGCRIDTWCKQNFIGKVDLIWMDVQGAELYVLKGMPNILKTVRGICTEVGLKPYYQGHTLQPDITNYLAKFNINQALLGGWSSYNEWECDAIYIKV